MKKPIVISDPFPRTLDLIFTKKKLIELKTKYKVLIAPDKKKDNFMKIILIRLLSLWVNQT